MLALGLAEEPGDEVRRLVAGANPDTRSSCWGAYAAAARRRQRTSCGTAALLGSVMASLDQTPFTPVWSQLSLAFVSLTTEPRASETRFHARSAAPPRSGSTLRIARLQQRTLGGWSHTSNGPHLISTGTPCFARIAIPSRSSMRVLPGEAAAGPKTHRPGWPFTRG